MDDIFDAIEKSSASRGVEPVWKSATLRSVWKATCSLAEGILLSQRSVCIPNVASFLVQEELTHSGTWNIRRSFVPQLVLAPSFQSSCHVANPVAVSQAQVGTKPVVVVNLVTVAEAVGGSEVSRHTVAEMLKSIARTVGSTYLSCTSSASSLSSHTSLNFGFAMVDLVHGKASVRWSKEFIARLQASYGVHKNDQVALHRRAASASSASRSAVSTAAPRGVNAAETLLVPRPPDSSKSIAASSDRAVPTGLPSAAVPAATIPPTNVLVPELDPVAVTSASPVRGGGEGMNVQPPLSPFYRHKFRKLQVRRQRKEEGAFPETWSRQLKEKVEQQAVEAEENRRLASEFVRSAAAEIEMERALAEARRVATTAVHQENFVAAATHRAFLLPKYEPMGHLLKDRPGTARLPPESRRVLEQQVAERRERERREAEENAALGQRLAQEAADYIKNEKAAKLSRFLRTRQYCKPNEIRMREGIKSLKEQLSGRVREESSLNSSPRCFLAVPDDVILAKKDQADEVVKAEKRVLEQYSARKRQEAREKKAAQEQAARAVDAMVTKSCILHQYEVSQRTLHQLENREMWLKQMKERQEREAGMKRVDATRCGPQAALRNDSSDDES